MNNPCLQFFHIHGQFHKPESSPLLFVTFFRGRGKEGSWFGVVGGGGGGGEETFVHARRSPVFSSPIVFGPEDCT